MTPTTNSRRQVACNSAILAMLVLGTNATTNYILIGEIIIFQKNGIIFEELV